MAVIGKNIIENLTIAMYENNYIIFREYIQNSADQIDKAIDSGLADPSDLYIDIDIDSKEKRISIYDNATGLPREEFKIKLLSIADSDKDRDEDKGFRGIGRLGGLACCDTLIFRSSVKGEDIESIMTWDARLLRDIINDPSQRPHASDLVDMVTRFEEKNCGLDEHFFEVRLLNILDECKELLDARDVQKYLQAVAPVPYSNQFIFRSKIEEFLQQENQSIDEYKILINGEQIFKGYTTNLYEGPSEKKVVYDEIIDLEFRKFSSDEQGLLAWMWFGISSFKKQIPAVNLMRGIRLRRNNIQIGNSETLSYPRYFKEARGNYYFVGEIFAVHKELIPNARRDYFIKNPTYRAFEMSTKQYLYDDLYRLYHFASDIKNAKQKEVQFASMQKKYSEKVKEGKFINKEDERKSAENLKKQEEIAKSASRTLEKRRERAENNPLLKRVLYAIEKGYDGVAPPSAPVEDIPKNPYMTHSLTRLTRQERKLVSRIYSIIKAILPQDISESVIKKIQEELSK